MPRVKEPLIINSLHGINSLEDRRLIVNFLFRRIQFAPAVTQYASQQAFSISTRVATVKRIYIKFRFRLGETLIGVP